MWPPSLQCITFRSLDSEVAMDIDDATAKLLLIDVSLRNMKELIDVLTDQRNLLAGPIGF